MKTPAFNSFLDQVGKVVHHLNTIAVGISAVETGVATKPASMDISWHPTNASASGRQARAFALRATLVTVAEELNVYISDTLASPATPNLASSSNLDRSEKLKLLKDHFSIKEEHIFLGPLLLIHWRNRIIHRASKAGLTKDQRSQLLAMSNIFQQEYKNLDPKLLLDHFDKNTPTLKDVSSLIAMTINFAKLIEQAVPEPTTYSGVMQWIEHYGIAGDLDRIKRIAVARNNKKCVTNLLNTHCPSLEPAYAKYCDADVNTQAHG